MTIEEIKSEIAKIKDTEEYAQLAKEFVNDASVKAYLATENGKQILQPINDSYFSKGLETWKNNNLDKLVNEKIKLLNPEQDERDIAINDLKAELEEMKATANREKMLNFATQIATEKGLPVNLVSYFIGADEEATKSNLAEFEKAFSTAVAGNVDSKLKNQHIPPVGDEKEVDPIVAAFQQRNPNIKVKLT